jgi:Cu+-exporting ATPase
MIVPGALARSCEDQGCPGINQSGARASSEPEEIAMKDPVCGMTVDPAKAAGSSVHNGVTYYFCSPSCKARFDANPSQYVK